MQEELSTKFAMSYAIPSLLMGEVKFKSAENKIAWVSEDIKASQGYAGAAADFSDSM